MNQGSQHAAAPPPQSETARAGDTSRFETTPTQDTQIIGAAPIDGNPNDADHKLLSTLSAQLVRYEAARQALTEAVMFDEVMSVIDAAQRAALWAKQANETELVEKATELRVRAQRKAGEMLIESAKRGERATNTANLKQMPKSHGDISASPPTLEQIGITPVQSSRYQQLASMTEEHFEAAVATAKDETKQVTTAFVLREARTATPTKRPREERVAEIAELARTGHNIEQIAERQGISVVSADHKQLEAAFGLERRLTWPQTLEEALRSPMYAALLRARAARLAKAARAIRSPVFDFKKAAAGDRDDDVQDQVGAE